MSTNSAAPNYHNFGRYQRYIDPITRDPLIRGYFEIVATLFLVSFFLLFAIRPTLNTVFGLRRKAADLAEVDKKLNDKIQALIEAQSTYAKYAPQVPLLDRALPNHPEVDTMVIDLENLETNGVVVNNLSVSGAGLTADAWKQMAGFKEGVPVPLSYTVTLNGDFASGQVYLKKLLTQPRILSVDSISFASGTDGKLSISISGRGYFMP